MGDRPDPRRNKPTGLAVAILYGVLCGASAQAESVAVKQTPIPDAVWQEMVGKSWHPNRGCPSRANLVLLSVPYRNFNDQTVTGELIVVKSAAPALARIFSALYASPFRIARMERIDKYGGSDDASMAANNTSAFNCRTVAGSRNLSAHAFGMAIDINPIQNPYVKGTEVDPPQGRAFDSPAKRQAAHDGGQPGIILARGPTVIIFKQNGWTWGGEWTTLKHYQHFSSTGR